MLQRALSLGLLLLLSACASSDPDAPRTPSESPEKSSPRLLAKKFVSAINAPDPEAASALIHWETYVAQDAKLMGLSELLRRRYASQPDTTALDKPLFKDTTVTSRQLLDSTNPEQLLGQIVRKRFEKEVRAFHDKEARVPCELLAFNQDIRATHASIRMPNGQITEFKVISRESRYWLVPLW
jgi:hypothetical protein